MARSNKKSGDWRDFARRQLARRPVLELIKMALHSNIEIEACGAKYYPQITGQALSGMALVRDCHLQEQIIFRVSSVGAAEEIKAAMDAFIQDKKKNGGS